MFYRWFTADGLIRAAAKIATARQAAAKTRRYSMNIP
jgi:hypothetical protein